MAEVAARHCHAHLGWGRLRMLGGLACGACWERAIRDDERFAVEFGLPREFEPDPEFIDEVAVERACRGERVALTRAERAEAVRRLRAAGVPGIHRRLNLNCEAVRAILATEVAPVAAGTGLAVA